MSITFSKFSIICEHLLTLLTLLLQVIALSTSWWATFTAREDLGKPKENGHYGLWTLCSTKGPRWVEDCDPLDTFFQAPAYLVVSGILCVIHLLLVFIFIPLGFLRTVQIFKSEADICIKTKTLCLVEALLSLLSTLIAIAATIFASIGENDQKEYSVVKGWSFWIQVFIIFLDAVIFSISTTECIRFWRLQRQQQIDPQGKRAETYGNPSFDADSPDLPRFRSSNNGTNGAIAFTESSGFPYGTNETIPTPTEKKRGQRAAKDSVQALTYENESYLESSPRVARRFT